MEEDCSDLPLILSLSPAPLFLPPLQQRANHLPSSTASALAQGVERSSPHQKHVQIRCCFPPPSSLLHQSQTVITSCRDLYYLLPLQGGDVQGHGAVGGDAVGKGRRDRRKRRRRNEKQQRSRGDGAGAHLST